MCHKIQEKLISDSVQCDICNAVSAVNENECQWGMQNSKEGTKKLTTMEYLSTHWYKSEMQAWPKEI
jgi:hypothetical protein